MTNHNSIHTIFSNVPFIILLIIGNAKQNSNADISSRFLKFILRKI